MENTQDNSRTIIVISVWAATIPGQQPAWRGSIRTIDGQRMSFSSLTHLNRLLCELSGWEDSPTQQNEDKCSE
jgi:hypothetical protein